MLHVLHEDVFGKDRVVIVIVRKVLGDLPGRPGPCGRGVVGVGRGEANAPIEGDANGGRGIRVFVDYIKLRPGDLKVTASRSLILHDNQANGHSTNDNFLPTKEEEDAQEKNPSKELVRLVRLPQLEVGGLLEQGDGCVGRGSTSEVEGTDDRGANNGSGIGSVEEDDEIDGETSVLKSVHIRLTWIPYLGIRDVLNGSKNVHIKKHVQKKVHQLG